MTEEELRDLQERVSLIHEMTEHPGWPIFIDKLRHTMLIRQTRIIQGRCTNYEEYVKEVSFTDGMEYVMTLPTRLDAELDLALLEAYPEEPEDDRPGDRDV